MLFRKHPGISKQVITFYIYQNKALFLITTISSIKSNYSSSSYSTPFQMEPTTETTRPELVVLHEGPPPPEEQQLQSLMCKVNQSYILYSTCMHIFQETYSYLLNY